MADKIKRAWIVCGLDGFVLCDDNSDAQEFKTEKAALRRAAEWINTSDDTEAWVFALTHVVERPDGDPIITPVK